MLIVAPGDSRGELLTEQVGDASDLLAAQQHRALAHSLHAARLAQVRRVVVDRE